MLSPSAASGQGQQFLLGRRELLGLGLGVVDSGPPALLRGSAAQRVVERALWGLEGQLRGDAKLVLGRGELTCQRRERVGARVGSRESGRLGGCRGGVGRGRRDGRSPRRLGRGGFGEVAGALLAGLLLLSTNSSPDKGGGEKASYVGESFADVRHLAVVCGLNGMRKRARRFGDE